MACRLSYNGPIHSERRMGASEISMAESGAKRMSEFVLRIGSRSAQGVRSNNEDNYAVDMRQRLFVVADGMGGQDRGEVASKLAVEIIPKSVHDHLAVNEAPEQALLGAMAEANQTIVEEGRTLTE